MLRTTITAVGVIAAVSFAVAAGVYALLVLGSRPGVEYYYGR